MDQLVTAGLHHVGLISSDAQRSLDFYRDLLGMSLVKRSVDADEPGSWQLYFGDAEGRPGTLLSLVEWAGAPRGHWGVGGVHHVAFGVEDEVGLLRWKRRLTDAGVAVSGPYDRRWFHSLYFTDPDGQILEIATRGPGYTLDESADALGERTIVPAAENLAGSRDEAAIALRTWSDPVPEVTGEMRLQGLHHVSSITGDVAAADAFVRSALGLRLVKRTVNQDAPDMPHWFWASYDGTRVAPHSAFTLFGFPPRGRPTRAGVGQASEVVFRAGGLDALGEWRERLLAQGVDASELRDHGYYHAFRFRMPDGMPLALASDGPGFTVDEAPGELGRALRLPAALAPRAAEIEAALPPLR